MDYSRVTHSRARFMAFSEARVLNLNQINSTCMKSLNREEIKSWLHALQHKLNNEMKIVIKIIKHRSGSLLLLFVLRGDGITSHTRGGDSMQPVSP